MSETYQQIRKILDNANIREGDGVLREMLRLGSVKEIKTTIDSSIAKRKQQIDVLLEIKGML